MDFDINKEFKDFKTFYSCSKCHGTGKQLNMLSCKHFMCVECLNKPYGSCPQCSQDYCTLSLEKNNKFLEKIHSAINRIEKIFPIGNYLIENVNFDINIQKEEPTVTFKGNTFKFSILKAQNLKRNPKGETPLHFACKRKDFRKVEALLQEEIDVNCIDWSNSTPLHDAVMWNAVECVDILLKNGALINVPMHMYSTPLHHSFHMGFYELSKTLIEHGANKNALDIYGNTPFDYCKDPEVAKSMNNIHKVHEDQFKLIFNCSEINNNKKQDSNHLLEDVTQIEGVQVLVVSQMDMSSRILAALLRAIPIVRHKDLSSFLKGPHLDFTVIPLEIHTGYQKSLWNRLNRLPKLFDAMKFHLLKTKRTHYECLGIKYGKLDMRALIEIAGGSILNRAPSETTVNMTFMPYHTQNHSLLSKCSHYVVYDHCEKPLLQYNMPELRHVSAEWIVKCIVNFEILELS